MADGKKRPEKKGPEKTKPEKKKPGIHDTEYSLREYAEERLARAGKQAPNLAGKSEEEIVHELQVHQIELEMQAEELRRTHLELEESRDKYLDLYEYAPLGYLTLTDKGLICEANLTGATLLGAGRSSLIGTRFSKIVAGNDCDTWRRYFIRVLNQDEKLACSLSLVRGGGAVFPARLECIRLKDSCTGTATVRVAVSDISDLKRMEEELIQRSADISAANDELIVASEELRGNEAKLIASLREKEALLSEVHHRVKNNLAAFISLLSLDGTYEETESGRRLKKDLQNRARSMALIHETLYRTRKYSSVDMGVYLSSLTDQVAGTYQSSGEIRIIVDAGGISLDLARATPCGLIINELITNAFKHAFPVSFDVEAVRHESPSILVSLSLMDGMYSLLVRDNGIGIPETFDPAKAVSLGLKLVNFLAHHQLRATIDLSRKNGTEYLIRFRESTA